jgi:sugar lactone lactonase YvrE
MRSGYILIPLCVLLTIASLLFVTLLPAAISNSLYAGKTSLRLDTVMLALRQYQAATGALPCPADASLPEGNTQYGIAAANPASGCMGGTPAANYSDTANRIVVGMVPVRALNLPDTAGLDNYGRKITYAVDTDATVCYTGTLTGTITVSDNGIPATSTAVLVSHGQNGHGAFVSLPGASGSASRLNAGSTDADELTNAHVNTAFSPITPLSTFVDKVATASFDDLVVYKSSLFNLNTAPASAAALLPQITPPANTTYYTGETLLFTVTYAYAVTVTGTPRLALTIGSNTRYANYTGGSGTTRLTFSYTVQSSDYAPGGISVGATIDANGGTLTSSCLTFTAPVLSGVAIKTMTLYVTDYNNNRVEKFDSSGNYLSQFLGGGFIENILGGLVGILFNHPYQVAVDTSGNLWVADWGNNVVEAFTASGSYLSQIGFLAGLLPGQFINPTGLTFDGSGTLWVADSGNNRIEKFSSSGSYLSQFGSYGTGNGKLSLPSGIAVDSAGNLWIADSGNNRIEEFSASGGYLSQLGSYGTGAGQFSTPCALAFDTNGNLWVSDYGNNRVEKFSASGSYLGQFGSYGSGNGQFSGPCGIAIDLTGYVWVADANNNRVEKFSALGSYLGQFGSYGTGNGQFKKPLGITLHYQ